MTVLEGKGLRYERGGRVIFHDVDLRVGPGERLAVLGPSGSGKTSLLAVLGGLATPVAGEVLIDGVPAGPAPRPGVAIVLQGYGLVSLLTAAENIEVVLRATGLSARDAVADALDALELVGLDKHGDHLVQELSGGQQQRVAVARALALRPAVLIADEPTAEQDQATRTLVLDRLLAVADSGAALILATHDPEVAERCSSFVTLRSSSPGLGAAAGPNAATGSAGETAG
jgi:putative ABC transport system ATP-binding protein